MVGMSELTLKAIEDVADGTRLYRFSKPAGFEFKPGQYVAIKLRNLSEPDEKGGVRSFSIASAPYEDEVAFSMRSGESGFKKTFWQMTVGEKIDVTKPTGFFTPDPEDKRPIVFLAGGVGITPVRSILRQMAHESDDREIVLLYANRHLKDAAFHEELKTLSLPHFRYITILSQSQDACASENDERGYICAKTLEKYLPNVMDRWYFVVGAPEFSNAMQTVLDELGIPKELRKMDPFTGLRSQPKK